MASNSIKKNMKTFLIYSIFGILALFSSIGIAPSLGLYYQFSITICIFFLIGVWLIKDRYSINDKLFKGVVLIFPFFLVFTLVPRLVFGAKGILPIVFLTDWAPLLGVFLSLIINKRAHWVLASCIGIISIGYLIAINFSVFIDGQHSQIIKTTSNAPNLQTLEGEEIPISNFKGKTIVLDFWFRGCKPCEESMPDFERLCSTLQRDPNIKVISVLGLDRSEFKRDSSFLKMGFKYDFPVLMDVDWKLSEFFSVNGFPCLIIIDSESYVRYQGGFNPKWYNLVYNTKKMIKKINKNKI